MSKRVSNSRENRFASPRARQGVRTGWRKKIAMLRGVLRRQLAAETVQPVDAMREILMLSSSLKREWSSNRRNYRR